MNFHLEFVRGEGEDRMQAVVAAVGHYFNTLRGELSGAGADLAIAVAAATSSDEFEFTHRSSLTKNVVNAACFALFGEHEEEAVDEWLETSDGYEFKCEVLRACRALACHVHHHSTRRFVDVG